MEMFKLILSITASLTPIGILFFMVYTYIEYNKNFKTLNKKINYIELLVDVAATQIFNPAIRQLYIEMKKRGYNNMMSAKDESAFLREQAVKFYLAEKDNILKWLEENDDITLTEKYKQRFQEIDSILNLIGTLDENTPPEQEKIIMDNIHASISKLEEMRWNS